MGRAFDEALPILLAYCIFIFFYFTLLLSHRLHKLHRLWNCAGGDCLGRNKFFG
nr:MAG TPA: hypothetical protein [Caudoviricetes sp.]